MSNRTRSGSSKDRTMYSTVREPSRGVPPTSDPAMDKTTDTYAQTLEQTVGNIENKMRELEGEVTKIKIGIPTLKDVMQRGQGSPSFIQELKDRNEKQLAESEAEKKRLENDKIALENEVSKLKAKLSKKDTEVRQKDQELQRAQTRLSEIMGNKLTNNNPDIADLSDQNRPSKLAEKYTELYDNEWTDAFEDLQTLGHYDEVKCVQTLLQLLAYIEQFCTDKWLKFVNSFKDVIQKKKKFTLPDYANKQLKDIAKMLAPEMVDDVYKEFLEEANKMKLANRTLLQSRTVFQSKGMQPYLKGCVELCWLMAAQDPPVTFKTDFQSHDRFDSNVLKAYTQSGDTIEYVVWLPLLLHKDGPLLSKGVAQGRGNVRRPQSAPAGARDHSSSTGENRFSSSQVRNTKEAWPSDDNHSTVIHQPGNGPVYVDVASSRLSSQGQGNYQQSSVGTYSDGLRDINTSTVGPNHTQSTHNVGVMLGNQSHHTRDVSQFAHHRQESPMDHDQAHANAHVRNSSTTHQKQQIAQNIPWNHTRYPTQEEIQKYMKYMYQDHWSERTVRIYLGDELFELCRDFKIYNDKVIMAGGEVNRL